MTDTAERPKFTVTADDGTEHVFTCCAGCGCLISYYDQHPCFDGYGPR